MSASYIFIKTTRLKLNGTAAKFCSAKSKAIQQANPALAPLQLGMVALALKKRLASQTHVHVCMCASANVNNLAK